MGKKKATTESVKFQSIMKKLDNKLKETEVAFKNKKMAKKNKSDGR